MILIRVDGTLYRPVGDLPAAKAAIVAAARAGGEFVSFLLHGAVTEVFVTGSTAIRIEVVDEELHDRSLAADEEESTFGIDDL